MNNIICNQQNTCYLDFIKNEHTVRALGQFVYVWEYEDWKSFTDETKAREYSILLFKRDLSKLNFRQAAQAVGVWG